MADWVRQPLGSQAAQTQTAGQGSERGQPGNAADMAKPGSSQLADAPKPRERRSKRRTITIVAVVAVLVAGAIAAGGSYFLLRTKGSPQETAQPT